LRITTADDGWNNIGIRLNEVNSCIISDLRLSLNPRTGIRLFDSDHNTISNNIIESDSEGISLFQSNSNIITQNTISDGRDGISLYTSSNQNIVSNNVITNGFYGIEIDWSDNNTISDNHLENNERGIMLYESLNNTFSNNTLIDNEFSMWGESYDVWATHNIDSSNTINGNSLYYFVGQSGFSIPQDAGHVILVDCHDVEIKDQIMESGGVDGFNSTNLMISDNYFSGSAIVLFHSSSNTIQNNTLTGIFNGIYIENSDNDIVLNNTMTRGYIYIIGSSWSRILENTLYDCVSESLNVYDFNFGEISGNTIINTSTEMTIY
jgi:parallel beta-helix repeat protein